MIVKRSLFRLYTFGRNFCQRPINRHHSISTAFLSGNKTYNVHVIPALTDNYMYVISDKISNLAIAIDAVEPKKVLDVVNANNLDLKAALTTHHHFDHAGGNLELKNLFQNLPVYGMDERIEGLTTTITHNETIQIEKFSIKCLHTPCHTSGHICYFFNDTEPICFTGDTLFVAGCGRFFEGSAEQMLTSLQILSRLPHNTIIYCGHEYTVSNLKFALSIEPNNTAVINKLKSVEGNLEKEVPSVPSTIGEELLHNPFMRVHEFSVQEHVIETNPVAVMATLRQLKDNF